MSHLLDALLHYLDKGCVHPWILQSVRVSVSPSPTSLIGDTCNFPAESEQNSTKNVKLSYYAMRDDPENAPYVSVCHASCMAGHQKTNEPFH